MKKSDKVRAAATFDVRGTITIGNFYCGHQTYLYPKVRLVTTKDKWPILEWLKETFGGCISNADPDGYRHYWSVSNRAAIKFLTCISPFFKNERRIKQAKMVIEEWPHFGSKGRGHKLTKKQMKKRISFVKRFKRI